MEFLSPDFIQKNPSICVYRMYSCLHHDTVDDVLSIKLYLFKNYTHNCLKYLIYIYAVYLELFNPLWIFFG